MGQAHYTRNYTVHDVPWRLRDQVQLRAVLAPIVGRYRSRAEIPALAQSIRRRWWRALGSLGGLGWAPVQRGRTSRRAARHCPMAFLMVYGKPRTCCLRTACPFCWARRTALWWDQVDAAFFRDAPGGAPPAHGQRAGRAIELEDAPRAPRKARAAGYKLVVRSRTYPIHPYVTPPGGEKVDLLRDFYLARTAGKGVHFRDSQPWFVRLREVRADLAAITRPGLRAGCFENIVADLDGAGVWRVSVRQVWLVPAGADLPVITPPPGVLYAERVVDAPWRNQVMKAVAYACVYPRAMLSGKHGGAPAYQLVTARAGLRLAALFGAFRNSGKGA